MDMYKVNALFWLVVTVISLYCECENATRDGILGEYVSFGELLCWEDNKDITSFKMDKVNALFWLVVTVMSLYCECENATRDGEYVSSGELLCGEEITSFEMTENSGKNSKLLPIKFRITKKYIPLIKGRWLFKFFVQFPEQEPGLFYYCWYRHRGVPGASLLSVASIPADDYSDILHNHPLIFNL